MKILLFQYEPFHEELGPGFAEAFAGASDKLVIWLNEQSLKAKGDVFCRCRLSPNVSVRYHKGLSTESGRATFVADVDRLEPDMIIFLTLQQPADAAFAPLLSRPSRKVFGVVHNTSRLAKHPEICSLYSSGAVTPIFLAPHVEKTYHTTVATHTPLASHIIYNVFRPQNALSQQQELTPLRLVILGNIKYKKLHLMRLLRLLAPRRALFLGKLKIVIAGGGGDKAYLMEDVRRNHLEDLFEFTSSESERKSSYEEYYRAIEDCQAVWCLDPRGLAAKLVDAKITSSVPSALSFGKCLVGSEELAQRYGVADCCLSGNDLSSQLDALEAATSHTPTLFAKLAERSRQAALRMLEHNVMEVQRMLS